MISHPNNLIESLDALAFEMSPLKHPFYQAWTAGTLPLQRLREYAMQYYPHVAAFPRYLSAMHSRCNDIATRQALLENLIDEERGPHNHPELWLRFSEALGLSRTQVLEAEPLPAARALIDTFDHLSHDSSLTAGLAALYVYESQIPAIATAKIEGLKRFYGITDEEGLRFFAVHQRADREHARTVGNLIEQHGVETDDRRTALEAGTAALQAVWNILDTV
jgi:pyrroloquinoline-quinone synthase